MCEYNEGVMKKIQKGGKVIYKRAMVIFKVFDGHR